MTSATYVGRFAPSPTGPLHFGSLLAAMASYCDARHHGGHWRLRIDDIDPPRAIANAATHFQHTLHSFGFHWDGPVIFQSEHSETYKRYLRQLNENHGLYVCSCSRRALQGTSIYPNICKPSSSIPDSYTRAADAVAAKLTHGDMTNAIRVSMDTSITFTDLIQGNQTAQVGQHLGDTVVVRRDDLFAYALACAVDDANGITHVVRGADLLPTTATQIGIMQWLNLHVPQYAHIPVALNSNKQKLSKQTHAKPIDTMAKLPTLQQAWQSLGQSPLNVHSTTTFWQAAIPAWDIHRVPKSISCNHEWQP